MEGIPTMLTDEKQPLVGPIPLAGMRTDRAGLRGIMRINLDRHTLMQEGFIGEHGVQFSKGPLGRGGIGLSLLFARFFARAAFGSLADIGQVLQAKERVRMRTHDLLTHDMIGVGFQPSLPPTDDDQSPGRRTGAFSLQTLSSPCVMIGLGNKAFAGMEGLLAPGGSGHRQVAHPYVYPDDRGVRGVSWLCYFHLQGDEQIKVVLGLVIPQLGGPDMRAMLNQGHMLSIACIRQKNSPLQRQDADTVLCLEAVVMPK